MRYVLAAAALLLLAALAQAVPQSPPKRKIPCKTSENAASCYWTRGRLQEYEGTPAYRLGTLSVRPTGRKQDDK
jgi:hypothetical protein